jgi:hypothetical protein
MNIFDALDSGKSGTHLYLGYPGASEARITNVFPKPLGLEIDGFA